MNARYGVLCGVMVLASFPVQAAGFLESLGEKLNEVGKSIAGDEPDDHGPARSPNFSEETADSDRQDDNAQEDAGAQPADTEALTRQAQRLLNARGFNAGPADGISGKATRNAICHYQASTNQDLDPRATTTLIERLSASQPIEKVDYSGLWESQCQIAHLNNLNNLQAAEYNSYEGALTPDDVLCRRLVAPFELQSNFDFIREGLGDYVSDSLSSLFSGDEVADPSDAFDLEEAKLQAKKANWLPLDWEIAYGQRLHEARMAQTNLILSRDNKRRRVRVLYEEADATLERVLAGIADDQPYDFQLFLIDDKAANAEALPGGYLHVNTGVFDTDHADLILGHEIGHVVQRHTTRELQARLLDTVETVDDLKSMLSSQDGPSEAFIEKVLVLRGAIAGYSQSQELQADACSVRIAASGDRLLEGAIDGYISELESGQSTLRRPMSTHPAYPERKGRMMDVLRDVESVPTVSQQ